MEITFALKKQILAYGKEFTGAETIYFHKFANKPGYMLVVETANFEGFIRFLNWMETEVERKDIETIRVLPEEDNPFLDFEKHALGFINYIHSDFQVTTEINDGRISNMAKENYDLEGGNEHAI